MKKLIAVILSSLILCSMAACSSSGKTEKTSSQASTVSAVQSDVSDKSSDTSKTEISKEDTSKTESSKEESSKEEISVDANAQAILEEVTKRYDFNGVAYIEKDGKPYAYYVAGKIDNGDPIKLDTPMPIGSVSKQFCAAAILYLRDQGKLSVDDTLGKYFPEYEAGKDITLKNLLLMRSGILTFTEDVWKGTSTDKTYEENTEWIKNWIFTQPLVFEQGKKFDYSNSNFFLLGEIVEKVSGKKYIDFLREAFFEPLGMKNTGSVEEMAASAEWAKGVMHNNVDLQPALTKGAGNLVTTASDLTLWLNSLTSGKAISAESYKEMTTSPNSRDGYGYGIKVNFAKGIGHAGIIGKYTAIDYINTDKNLTITLMSSNLSAGDIQSVFSETVLPLIE